MKQAKQEVKQGIAVKSEAEYKMSAMAERIADKVAERILERLGKALVTEKRGNGDLNGRPL